MKKKVLLFFAVVFLFVSLFPHTLSADMGPKPSVSIKVEGIEGMKYFVTLLSDKEQYGPWSKIEEVDNHSSDAEDIAFAYFANYDDPDGFCFLGNMSEMLEGDGEFSWTYYPPDKFKIAIYCFDESSLSVSDVYERDAFNAYYTVQYEKDLLKVDEEIHLGKALLSGIFRALVTIAVEMALAYLFKYRERKQIMTILIVNIITQLLLNVFLSVCDYLGGILVWMMMFVIGEIAVLILEYLIYLIAFKKEKRGKLFLYTLLANLLSGVFTFIGTIATYVA